VAGLASSGPDFPIYLWDRLLHQAVLTLNLLQTSRLHPHISTAAQLYGPFDYNKPPLAPTGTKIIVHEKTNQRQNWAPNGKHVDSLGPEIHHYLWQNVYITPTASECIVDTLEKFPHNYQMPQISPTDRLHMAAHDITDTVKHHHPYVPFAIIGDATITAISTLAYIFKK
jgi:hypothetical protein